VVALTGPGSKQRPLWGSQLIPGETCLPDVLLPQLVMELDGVWLHQLFYLSLRWLDIQINK
jgi:hypothetical protein